MKYNLGGRATGSHFLGSRSAEYKNVNLEEGSDFNHDITDLDAFIKEDGVVDEFFMEHTLEHVPITKYKKFLEDLKRKLRPRGQITVIHTDAGHVINLWQQGHLPFRCMKKTLFPPADYVAWNPLMAHQNMWTGGDLVMDFLALEFSAQQFDAGQWEYDLKDEFYPTFEATYQGIPIKNLGVIAIKI
jgi:hypothetical protein|tara:strand:- start:1063 stop:1623 length:561 start_codon:yes stop_codon:yes gene_type:complete